MQSANSPENLRLETCISVWCGLRQPCIDTKTYSTLLKSPPNLKWALNLKLEYLTHEACSVYQTSSDFF